jgi:hypothetical protein
MEQVTVGKLQLEVDKDESFDYKKGKSEIFSIKDYLSIIDNEVHLIK